MDSRVRKTSQIRTKMYTIIKNNMSRRKCTKDASYRHLMAPILSLQISKTKLIRFHILICVGRQYYYNLLIHILKYLGSVFECLSDNNRNRLYGIIFDKISIRKI